MPKRKAPEWDLSDEQKRQAEVFEDMGFNKERAEEALAITSTNEEAADALLDEEKFKEVRDKFMKEKELLRIGTDRSRGHAASAAAAVARAGCATLP